MKRLFLIVFMLVSIFLVGCGNSVDKKFAICSVKGSNSVVRVEYTGKEDYMVKSYEDDEGDYVGIRDREDNPLCVINFSHGEVADDIRNIVLDRMEYNWKSNGYEYFAEHEGDTFAYTVLSDDTLVVISYWYVPELERDKFTDDILFKLKGDN